MLRGEKKEFSTFKVKNNWHGNMIMVYKTFCSYMCLFFIHFIFCLSVIYVATNKHYMLFHSIMLLIYLYIQKCKRDNV